MNILYIQEMKYEGVVYMATPNCGTIDTALIKLQTVLTFLYLAADS